ncbi:MAG: hypothetical protein KGI94_06550 [Paracoccaceae bacterium]|nr:hypothetical protein [Paracoccaceae bacterium]
MSRRFAIMAVSLALAAAAADAAPTQDAKVVFTAKDWSVRRIDWSDGAKACVAGVTRPDAALTLWADNRHPLRVQVYDGRWNFRPRSHAVRLQVDAGRPFAAGTAQLFRQSVIAEVPADAQGAAFLAALGRGRTVRLLADDGKALQSFSLAGAQAALGMLTRCAAGLP